MREKKCRMQNEECRIGEAAIALFLLS